MLKIRTAIMEDAERVAALGAIPELTWGNDHSLTAEDYAGHVPDDLFLVAEDQGNVVGFLLGEQLVNRGALLWTMAVAPERRGGGLGSALLSAFEDRCRSRGNTWIYATMTKRNERLDGFYRRHGWEFGQDVVEIVKSISPVPPTSV